jgi:hypothetical protein
MPVRPVYGAVRGEEKTQVLNVQGREINMMTKYKLEQYREALAMWEAACDALDQAQAALRDLDLDAVQTGYGPYRITVAGLATKAFQLLKELQSAECDECGQLISAHTDAKCEAWIK